MVARRLISSLAVSGLWLLTASPVPGQTVAIPRDTRGSSGTGAIIGDGTVAVTNAHIVNRCAAIVVLTDAGDAFKASLATIDRRLDVAVLRTSRSIGRPLSLSSFSLVPGDPLVASVFIGRPSKGARPELVRGRAIEWSDGRMVGMAALMQPGASGAPVIGPDGSMAGIVQGRLVSAPGRTIFIPSRDIARILAPLGVDPGSARGVRDAQEISEATVRVECL